MRKKRKISLKSLILLVSTLGYLLLSLIMGAYSIYSFSKYSDELSNANTRTFDAHMGQVSQLTENTDQFLQSIFLNNRDFSNLIYNRNEVDKYLAAYNILKLMDVQLTYNKNLTALFVIYDEGNRLYYKTQSGLGVGSKEQMKRFVIREAGDGLTKDQWQVITTDAGPYLVKLLGMRGVYMAAVIDFESVVLNVEASDTVAENKPRWIFHGDNGFMGDDTLLKTAGFSCDDQGNVAFKNKNGRYLIYSGTVPDTKLSMYMLLEDVGWIRPQISQIIILLVTVCCCIMCVISSILLRRQVTKPLQYLMETMNRIKDGQTEVTAEEYGDHGYAIEEFAQLNRTFNEMMAQIKLLKVRAYEEALEKQKNELNYLHLQIKPHFYLNCLKSLYALSYAGKYDKMQNMILEVSNHLRYMFRNNLKLVSLGEEKDFTRNYIRLMRDSMAEEIIYGEDIRETDAHLRVPPLIIQTFVENSIKYGFSGARALAIRVRVKSFESEGKSFLNVRVADNGPGYAEGELARLNGAASESISEKHVGIDNLKARLRLLYGCHGRWFFMNDGGAVSEIIIPIVLDGEVLQ